MRRYRIIPPSKNPAPRIIILVVVVIVVIVIIIIAAAAAAASNECLFLRLKRHQKLFRRKSKKNQSQKRLLYSKPPLFFFSILKAQMFFQAWNGIPLRKIGRGPVFGNKSSAACPDESKKIGKKIKAFSIFRNFATENSKTVIEKRKWHTHENSSMQFEAINSKDYFTKK